MVVPAALRERSARIESLRRLGQVDCLPPGSRSNYLEVFNGCRERSRPASKEGPLTTKASRSCGPSIRGNAKPLARNTAIAVDNRSPTTLARTPGSVSRVTPPYPSPVIGRPLRVPGTGSGTATTRPETPTSIDDRHRSVSIRTASLMSLPERRAVPAGQSQTP